MLDEGYSCEFSLPGRSTPPGLLATEWEADRIRAGLRGGVSVESPLVLCFMWWLLCWLLR